MPTNINDLSMSTAAAWEIDRRLKFHSGTGEMLEGLNYDHEGKQGVEGKDGFPLLQPAGISFSENNFAGANAGILKNPIQEELTLHYRVGSRKDALWVRRQLDVGAKKGLLDWLALIRDAMEISSESLEDPTLGNTIVKPMEFSISENESTQIAFYTILEVKLYLRPCLRTERHKLFCL
mgnify:CR=1 FL=1|tara:strand:+ start:16449 stop:16985 length:537 start_codon:yes stop_codon:yes gene_type:complete